MIRPLRFALVLTLCACAGAPRGGGPVETSRRTDDALRVELYLGRFRGDVLIPDAEFEAFERDVIATALPAGYTIVPARGTYRDVRGVLVREPTMLLIVVFPADADRASVERAIEAVRTAYCERFDQASVLRVDTRVTIDF